LLDKILDILKDILFGVTTYEMTRDALKLKWHVERALMLVSIGDMLGIPLTSYYRLRLIPYLLPTIEVWKTSILKERDILESLLS